MFLPETNESVEMMDSTVVECVTVGGESPEAEAEAEAEGAAPSDGAPAGCEGQATPRSSPDTNSPVMISVEVGRLQITHQTRPNHPPDTPQSLLFSRK